MRTPKGNLPPSRSFLARIITVLLLSALLKPCDLRATGAIGPGPSRPVLKAATPASVALTDLRCEYLKDPLGLDVRQPRLSWKLTATDPKARGQRQTAYHLQVASSANLLRQGKADLWDSQEVKSEQSQLVVYQGQPLRSGQACHWRVRVKDEHGVFSAWSQPTHWSVGLLEASDWSAKWIGTDQLFVRKPGSPPPDNTMPDPWFRKVFSLPAKPERAMVYVASIGYHELYVNGRKVGDAVLAPCVTDLGKRARYVTYDVTELLRPGQNALGLWLGTSWSIFPHFQAQGRPATPMVIAQADIELAGGGSVRVVTDETWKTHPSPNTLLGVWDFMYFGGELYDAQKEIPNWAEPGLDDSAWKAASVFHPPVALSAQKVEPNRCVQEIRPVALAEPAPGVYRVDMGVNFAGWIEARLAGHPGDRINFKFSERTNEAMTHQLHSAYVIGPSGKGLFRNRFNYSVGRWVQIEGLRQKPSLADLRGWLVRTDYQRAARFACANPLLNDIYKTTLWTFENLSLGGYSVDCPQRERMGYGGDAHATTETALDNYQMGAFYTKWAEDWRDVQGKAAAWGIGRKEGEAGSGKQVEAGNLPYTAPTYWGGGGPAWSGYCVTLPWEVYRRYGDKRILEENLGMIQRWLAFLETKAKNDMLVRWGGEWDFLGDWLWPGAEGVNGDTRETLFFNNCYWIYNLTTAARIAEAVDHGNLAAPWRARAQAVRAAVHKEFFRPEANSYVNGFPAYLSIALLVGLPPDSLRPAIWKRLEEEILVTRKGHFYGGITGGYFIIKNLLANNRLDLLYEMATKEDYPGWGDLLRRGATTFYEDWEAKLSYCHSSYLHIGMWFIEGLAGIRPGPDGAGYRHWTLKPGLAGDKLRRVNCAYESPYGLIESNWELTGGKLRLNVTVPPNTTATLDLPAKDPTSVTEGGLPLALAKGVKLLPGQAGQVALQIEAGRYAFEAGQ